MVDKTTHKVGIWISHINFIVIIDHIIPIDIPSARIASLIKDRSIKVRYSSSRQRIDRHVSIGRIYAIHIPYFEWKNRLAYIQGALHPGWSHLYFLSTVRQAGDIIFIVSDIEIGRPLECRRRGHISGDNRHFHTTVSHTDKIVGDGAVSRSSGHRQIVYQLFGVAHIKISSYRNPVVQQVHIEPGIKLR
ncbi:hypothetical protein D3C81_1409460 [compost metagenome]